MNAKTRARTIAVLEKCVADSTRPAALRRAATLRLSRLRSAAKPAAILARTTAPAPSEAAKFEAYQSFIALAAQRKALFGKRRTRGEQEAFAAILALMPASAPQENDPTTWRNFVAQIDGLLSEIKSIKHL
jgi:hypothetical protein